jgi:peptidyl-prolyl cis-trans isomerase D
MATLQNIRSKGPLLVIVIGLALFAFIAGDAWKVLQPHQSQDVGEVNGESISAQDFQALVEEYTEVIKFSSGNSALSDEQTNQIKDEVWRTYVNNKLIEKEAKKLGLVVSKAEIQAIINAGVHPMLQQTPFRNPQTGAFDKDMLKKFLVDYSKMNKAQMPSQYAEYYESMYKFWSFLEKSLIQARLQEKYQALITKSLFSNPVEAQDAFDARVEQSDLLLAAVPYSSIVDSTIVIKDSDLKAAYDKKKEQFKQYVETRNIKFIDVQVTASAEDRAALQKEMEEYTEQLTANPSDYTTFIRSTGSEAPYTDLFYTTKSLPADVTARLDSVAVGGVFGPYYNVSDNTLNSFKKLATAAMPDSIEFRQIQVYAADAAKTKTLADSIYNAIKGGANFVDLAKKYGQTGDSNWMTAAQYEGAQIDGDNLKFISAINSTGVNELVNLPLGQANVILQVTNKKAVKDKYKVAVVKREVEFSKETYNRAYNDFSQFIAANPSVEKMVANAEEAGYKLLDRADLYSSEHGIGGVRGTKEALRWAFDKAKPGEVSGLYECGESDHMMVVGLVNIKPEGYRPLKAVQEQLRAEIVKDKKAEKIMADMKAANATSLDQYKAMPNAVSDSLKMVTFAAPAYVSALRSSEPLVGAYASVAEVNKLSAPIKGNAGVFVLQVYGKDKLNDTFNAKDEEATLTNMHARFASRLMNDLYLKGNVKDTRYLFF